MSLPSDNQPSPICSLCECIEGVHAVFWKCPIFEGEAICCECCQTDSLKNDIDQKFSTKLGRTISKDEINEMCKACGRNYACQNENLASNLLNNTFIENTNELQN